MTFMSFLKNFTNKCSDLSRFHYVQVIPLYMKSDEHICSYFERHREDLDAITGSKIVIALAVEVASGDAAAIGRFFDSPIRDARFPGLKRSDLPCFWVEDGSGNSSIIPLPKDLNEFNSYIRAMTDAAEARKSAHEIKRWVLDCAQKKFDAFTPGISNLRGGIMSKFIEKIIATAMGVIFVCFELALAIWFPTPTQFQYSIFRIVLALASAGFVSMTPGFIEVAISSKLRAGGALAVFVIVFFYNPASLVVSPP